MCCREGGRTPTLLPVSRRRYGGPRRFPGLEESTLREGGTGRPELVRSDEEFHRHFLTVSSSRREVSPSAPAVTEMETESESSVVSQPPPGTEQEGREGCTDEVRSLKGWGRPVLHSVSD